ncbi:hypothetical protein GCM10025864_10140 [Luteimicrobium album]|uniref:DUF11 domain-containing protein n=1 Tax=Luteimicrobium album TaxID=1054550 RepID=A0ABQ6HXY3_9MICO|nr:isopeptide-forming domain-containing fimbrial protein [Luteimicrobium album]GMA23255.1 hypothetical protein GCM10025864_10140 [Luteimicrobium album]
MLGAFALVVTMGVGGALPAQAADTASLSITKTATETDLVPGQEFQYRITFQCTAGQVDGCVNAVLTDPLPDGIEIVPGAQPTTTAPNSEITVDGNTVKVEFHQDLGGGQEGLQPGVQYTLTIPVRVSPDYSADQSGRPIDNTATVGADNASDKSATATVTPTVEEQIGSSTTKSVSPERAPAEEGTAATFTITGKNTSNIGADSMVVSDPADAAPPAAPSSNPFEHLPLTGAPTVTLPKNADTVTVTAYCNGAWSTSEPAATPQLPPGCTGGWSDVAGISFAFDAPDGRTILAGASATIQLPVEQSGTGDLTDETAYTNTAGTVVTAGDQTADSQDDATYTVVPVRIEAGASKSWDPKEIASGDTSTATLGATNTSTVPVDTLTITEPESGSFPDGFTFTGLGSDGGGSQGIVWPTGATSAEITYQGCAGGPLTTTEKDTLPAPPDGCTPTGFTVTFHGEIVAGAEATAPFQVQADEDGTEQQTFPNEIGVVTGRGDQTSPEATANDTLTKYEDRLSTSVTKRITPGEIPAVPGQDATIQLSGKVDEFPASTTNAQQIVVSDPSGDPNDSEFYDVFDATGVVAVPIPDNATLTVNYWNGSAWVPVPGMTDLPSSASPYSANFPDGVDAHGVQFVYNSTDEDGFPRAPRSTRTSGSSSTTPSRTSTRPWRTAPGRVSRRVTSQRLPIPRVATRSTSTTSTQARAI